MFQPDSENPAENLCNCCQVPSWGFAAEKQSVTDLTDYFSGYLGISLDGECMDDAEAEQMAYENSNRFFTSKTVSMEETDYGGCEYDAPNNFGPPAGGEYTISRTTEPIEQPAYIYYTCEKNGLLCENIALNLGDRPSHEKIFGSAFGNSVQGDDYDFNVSLAFLNLGCDLGEFDLGQGISSLDGSTVTTPIAYYPWLENNLELGGYCGNYGLASTVDLVESYGGEKSPDDIIIEQISALENGAFPSEWSKSCDLNIGTIGETNFTTTASGSWTNGRDVDQEGFDESLSYKILSLGPKYNIRFRVKIPHTCYCKLWVARYMYQYYDIGEGNQVTNIVVNEPEELNVEILEKSNGLCFDGFPTSIDCNENYLSTYSDPIVLTPTNFGNTSINYWQAKPLFPEDPNSLETIVGVCIAGYSLIDGWEPPFYRIDNEVIICNGLIAPYWLPPEPYDGYAPIRNAIENQFLQEINVCAP